MGIENTKPKSERAHLWVDTQLVAPVVVEQALSLLQNDVGQDVPEDTWPFRRWNRKM